jgi:alkylhydroperoxidase family enzyme
MVRSLLHRTIRGFERRYDYDATYMHEILDASLPAFLKLLLAQAMNAHRDAVPMDALFAARIAAVRFEDCGPCAQLVVNMAREAGVAPATLRAMVARDSTALTNDARLGLALADAVLAHAPCDDVRDEIRRRWGEAGLITLAYAIAATRIYPTMKRALGHAHTCERLRVDGESIVAARAMA